MSRAPVHESFGRIAERLAPFREEPPSAGKLPQDVARAVRFIHSHLFDAELNVNFLKARCGLRNNNFSTRFRQALGVGPREYIESRRLAAADLLLREEKLEVYRVAVAVGYEHIETFCRAFQRQFRATPAGRRATGL